MKLFKDASLKEEVHELHLGELFAGQTKQYSFYILNDNGTQIKDIRAEIDTSEVKVVAAPKILKNKEAGELKLEWSPSLTIKKGLKAKFGLHCVEVWEG